MQLPVLRPLGGRPSQFSHHAASDTVAARFMRTVGQMFAGSAFHTSNFAAIDLGQAGPASGMRDDGLEGGQ